MWDGSLRIISEDSNLLTNVPPSEDVNESLPPEFYTDREFFIFEDIVPGNSLPALAGSNPSTSLYARQQAAQAMRSNLPRAPQQRPQQAAPQRLAVRQFGPPGSPGTAPAGQLASQKPTGQHINPTLNQSKLVGMQKKQVRRPDAGGNKALDANSQGPGAGVSPAGGLTQS
jgi:hypothetical protein